ncbi:MAG: Gfo/Idh/MocA family oxidoreductase, partial [Gemella haemolysans]|nr:Gfo/Idh/MocA family oxidoreductase [Gemella haemolysans]
MTNYGIVGTGYFGADLARSLEKIKDAKVTAVFDPENGEKVSKELNAKNCLSLEELVGLDEVDCVIVATPSNLHREPVLLAAKNGKHVFCEKPIALSYEDCKVMVETCRENNVIFMAGH